MKIHCKHDELVDPRKLLDNPENTNKHTSEQISALAAIIEYQGFRYPINVNKKTKLIQSGHARKLAAIQLGMKSVPVVYQDYESDEQALADLTSDNAIAAWSTLDLDRIHKAIADKRFGEDFDNKLLGIKDLVLPTIENIPLCDEDEIPEHVEPKTKLGDIYKLGDHRLMCGDSTSIDAVEKLMNNEKADLWLTDPPYGVAYKSNGAEDKHDKIANDDLPLEQMGEFWTTVASNALIVCKDKCSYYWFACQGGDQMMMMMMSIGRANWKVRHELIWVKDSMVMGRCDYHYKHEPILYGWKQDGTHEWYSDRKQTSVLEFKRPKKSEEHPTMKPVELIEYLIGNSSKAGQIILDTFGGSGTTLIAAEKTSRKSRLIEISPKYCDVIVARWEKYTGKKAELING